VEDSLKVDFNEMHFIETGCGSVKWINLAQDSSEHIYELPGSIDTSVV
jgi:hypothetical protein